jgi:hypothetical protein
MLWFFLTDKLELCLADDRIRLLEDQVWNLKETTKFLRERTDSLSSFNTVSTSDIHPPLSYAPLDVDLAVGFFII